MEPEKPGILTKIEVSESKKGVEMVAYGTELKGIVARRVTVPDTDDEQLLFGYDRFPSPEPRRLRRRVFLSTISTSTWCARWMRTGRLLGLSLRRTRAEA